MSKIEDNSNSHYKTNNEQLNETKLLIQEIQFLRQQIVTLQSSMEKLIQQEVKRIVSEQIEAIYKDLSKKLYEQNLMILALASLLGSMPKNSKAFQYIDEEELQGVIQKYGFVAPKVEEPVKQDSFRERVSSLLQSFKNKRMKKVTVKEIQQEHHVARSTATLTMRHIEEQYPDVFKVSQNKKKGKDSKLYLCLNSLEGLLEILAEKPMKLTW